MQDNDDRASSTITDASCAFSHTTHDPTARPHSHSPMHSPMPALSLSLSHSLPFARPRPPPPPPLPSVAKTRVASTPFSLDYAKHNNARHSSAAVPKPRMPDVAVTPDPSSSSRLVASTFAATTKPSGMRTPGTASPFDASLVAAMGHVLETGSDDVNSISHLNDGDGRDRAITSPTSVDSDDEILLVQNSRQRPPDVTATPGVCFAQQQQQRPRRQKRSGSSSEPLFEKRPRQAGSCTVKVEVPAASASVSCSRKPGPTAEEGGATPKLATSGQDDMLSFSIEVPTTPRLAREATSSLPSTASRRAPPFDRGDSAGPATTSASESWVLQEVTCVRIRPNGAQQCFGCTSRLAGHRCAFIGVRSFPRHGGKLDFSDGMLRSTVQPDDIPDFPTQFNETFTPDHADHLKTAAAHHLLPTLEKELAHALRDDCIRLRRELAARDTCDTCLHVIFGGAYKCMRCGRDVCLDCFEALGEEVSNPIPATSGRRRPSSAITSRGTGEDSSNPFDASLEAEMPSWSHSVHQHRLRRCTKRIGRSRQHTNMHTPDEFVPFTRASAQELESITDAMRHWRQIHPLFSPPVVSAIELDHLRRTNSEGNGAVPSWPHLFVNSRALGSRSASPPTAHRGLHASSVNGSGDDISCGRMFAGDLELSDTVGSGSRHPVRPSSPASSPSFASLWSAREPIVVDIGTDLLELEWSPKSLASQYGPHACHVYDDAQAAMISTASLPTTVGAFFEQFGRMKTMGSSRKIKDWPSTTDLRSEFPREYEDFMSILPVGNVTRRDGVLNVAAHAPINSNPPDLGPKGYFSEASDDREGGQGTTKLHMDVADAINLMLWAGPSPEGVLGAAAWDVFRVQDADKLRDFLYEHIAAMRGHSIDEVRRTVNDPIHSQVVFLDEKLRAELFRAQGVKPFRIWQRPGEAVFIPAGCAHQVCNFADCIKIASDFVSTQNVASCWKVTDEFRSLNKESELWRSDVLQLKAQLLWAWKSSGRVERVPAPNAAPSSTHS